MQTKRTGRTLALLTLVALVTGAAAAAQSAKLGRVYYEDHDNGYRFRYPHEWLVVPVKPDELEFGITCKMDGPSKEMRVGRSTYHLAPQLLVYKFEDEVFVVDEGEAGEEPAEGREPVTEVRRGDVTDLIASFSFGRGPLRDFDEDDPETDKEFEIRSIEARQRTWEAFTGDYDVVIDTWTFPGEDADIVLLFSVPEKHSSKWMRVFKRAAKSFERIEVREQIEYDDFETYEQHLAYHEQEASRTEGWRALPTPSEKFIVKTSSDNDDFIEDVIERLERSRELFERDFPPERPITEVSVVRICSNEDEFHTYGGTGGGTAGWFNPSTTELVLYDAVRFNRNMTFAVMSHEAFHQYRHFLFDESEAHRWFDEGHGDYYGGAEFRGRRVEVTPKMAPGIERLSGARELIRQGTYTPLERHLNFSHREWQTQGPTSVSCYEQSWSIIYMLRKGMLGELPRRVWKPEYADIIPNYMATLYEGYQTAYAELLAEREEEARAEGRELTEEEADIDRSSLDTEQKEAIWKAAMDASWGRIDLDEFEQDWITYVEKYLD